jgi:hypothetical protein
MKEKEKEKEWRKKEKNGFIFLNGEKKQKEKN